MKAEFYGEYANGSATVPPASNPDFPTGTTPLAFHQCAAMPVESLEVGFAPARVSALRLECEIDQRDALSICRTFRRADLESVAVADYSAISYIDQQVGRLLDALDDAGVADRTAVLFMGDQ